MFAWYFPENNIIIKDNNHLVVYFYGYLNIIKINLLKRYVILNINEDITLIFQKV